MFFVICQPHSRHTDFIQFIFYTSLNCYIFSSAVLLLLFLQRFTNEDHLSVHKHKHEMTLKFGPARTDSVIIAGTVDNSIR